MLFYMANWKCSVCSYIHEDDESPEICPVCGASREKFDNEEISEELDQEMDLQEVDEEEEVFSQVEARVEKTRYEHRLVSKEEE